MKTKQLPPAIQAHIDAGGADLLDGYIRFIKPQDTASFMSLLSGKAFWESDIPFATTAFGDILAWNVDGYIQLYRLVDGTSSIMMADDKFFFEDVNDEAFQKDYFDVTLFRDAEKLLGKLNPGQCYAFEPLPALGGAKDLKSAKITPLLPYVALMIDLA